MYQGFVNPYFFAYSPPTVNGELEGVLAVAKPGAIIVTGRGNRYHSTFQKARAQGAKVYTYWNVANAPYNLKNPEDAKQYLINGQPPPAWPIKAVDGKDRTQWPGTYLLDLRSGSPWLKHCIPNSGDVVDTKKFDGFFLDALGARTWSRTKTVDGVVVPGADWETWKVEEQTAWCTGSLGILRELKDELARRGRTDFELVCNNLWDLPFGHPSDTLAQTGDTHQNGCCLENPSGNVPSDYHKNYAKRAFGRMPRRVLVVDSTDADTKLWAQVEGVTHVCSVEKAVGETYAKVTPPVVPFMGWPPTESEDQLELCKKRVAELTAQNAALTTQRDEALARLATANKQIATLNDTLDQIHKLSEPVV